MKKTNYFHTTDLARKSQGIGSPPGRITHKIPLWEIDLTTHEYVKRADEDVEADKQLIKENQAVKNDLFVAETGYKRRKNTINTIDNDTQEPVEQPKMSIFKQKDVVKENVKTLTQIKYQPLQLVLDPLTGNTCAIFGSSKRGKSTAMMQIYRDYYMSQARKTLIPILFAKSTQIPLYDLPDLIISSEFDPNVIKYEQKLNRYSKNKFIFVNFIDDFIDLKHDLTLDNLLLTFRNSNLSTYICLQYVNTLSKAARSNVNNVLLFGQNTDEAAEVCIKVYLANYFKKNGIIGLPDQVAYFHKVTLDHGFFHVHPATGNVTICKLTVN
jgi:hypothetical protein